MTASRRESTSQCRIALQCAWPALLLATALLLPFLKTPFTIDDPLYLREAEHTLIDPLHPQAFGVVWSTDTNLRASVILPGGIAVPYLLLPTALAGYAEWVGHLTQLILLLITLFAASLIALRVGLSLRQARFAAILTAACPAILAMAATVMPDIPAMLFVALGMERIIVWRDRRRAHQAALAVLWLSLAALTRTHTILSLAAAAVLLLDGITPAEISASFRRSPVRFIPIFLVPLVYWAVSALTADPESGGANILSAFLNGPFRAGRVVQNLLAFLEHWTLVIPLAIPWLILRFRKIHPMAHLIAVLVAGALYLHFRWEAFPVAVSLLALSDILRLAIQRRDRWRLALFLWLFPAAAVIIYIHLPSKYLLPSVPAAAILLAALIPEDQPATLRWLLPTTAFAGVGLGILILLAVRDLAETQRGAVTALIVPYTQMGQRVWFAGHWGFQWYAEHAGGLPVIFGASGMQRGDIVIVSTIDETRFQLQPPPHEVLQRIPYTGNGIGRVMDPTAHTGFFSSAFGYLPWRPGAGQASTFEVWKIE